MNRERTTVFILAAGMGTRLRPITDIIPKVMVPVSPDGTSVLEHALKGLRAQGFKKFVFNLHYLPEAIISHFKDGSKWGVEIKYSDESEALQDTAGAIRHAKDLLSEDFLMLYGDHLHIMNFDSLIDAYEKHSPAIALVLKKSDLPQNGDLARLDASGEILEWIPRPHSIDELAEDLYLNTGFYMVSKKVLENIPETGTYHMDKELIPNLFSLGIKIVGLPTQEDILDIGTPEKLQHARDWYKNNLKKINDWHSERE